MSINSSNKKNEILLEMKDIKINGFADGSWHEIIRGIDLKLHRGEVLGLIGESGAGKSTMGKAAMGYAQPGCKIISGSIMFNGVDLNKITDVQKRKIWLTKISYVAQSAAAAFNPAHKLINQTIESAKRARLGNEKSLKDDAVQLYSTLQLPTPNLIGERYPHQVSGGQLQRIMTAMAISPRPELIIFDEPTTALDVTTQVEVLAAIREIIKKFNTAAIYITHDLAVVAQMADKIKVIRDGKEVEEATTTKMLSEPKQEYTKSLWSVRSLTKSEEKNSNIILSLKNVDAAYGKSKVLFDISIQVPKGKTLAIVGESGSGKSTLAKVITGLLPQTNGKISYFEKELPSKLKKRSKEELRVIQMIFQMPDTAINPRQTVQQIIGRPIEFYHGLKKEKKKKRIIELLNMIELDETYLNRYPFELSGGQKQRICIARALAANPELIICDEVTSALDQIVQEEILKLLQKLQKELEITYIFITHDIATVKAISDQIVVMHQGKIVEQGMKSQILNPPHPEYTELLLSSVPEMDPNWLTNLLIKRSNSKDI
jgi:peptide/nickel transport system ATP-binding protein|tara:strand:+ start:945 stop:2579 length:1635 start_codon:yes stop_codon:yes gene_type:complete